MNARSSQLTTATKFIVTGLVVLAIGAGAIGLVLAFMVGCAGDTKSAMGDVHRALALERASAAWSFGALVAAVAALTLFCYQWSRNVLNAVTAFLGASIVGFVLLTVASIELEIRGIQHCF